MLHQDGESSRGGRGRRGRGGRGAQPRKKRVASPVKENQLDASGRVAASSGNRRGRRGRGGMPVGSASGNPHPPAQQEAGPSNAQAEATGLAHPEIRCGSAGGL
jgi:hypothetical protein